jgi:uncharacterized protein (TIGR02246 family)
MATVLTPEALMQHRVQALTSRDIDAVMSEYAEDAVILTDEGILKGLEAIRAMLMQTFTQAPPGTLETLTIDKQYVTGDYIFVLYSIPALNLSGNDTFCIRNGKIVMVSGTARVSS